ncbi:LOW QUALITY PROTEIN: hypothetical protein V1477_008327 [Vespula maculifrons]|uniref:Transmembrane protein n=1 Tax=Vespula maculifrons TaxID=7453 RepID=A0ABD2CCP8_VESMC
MQLQLQRNAFFKLWDVKYTNIASSVLLYRIINTIQTYLIIKYVNFNKIQNKTLCLIPYSNRCVAKNSSIESVSHLCISRISSTLLSASSNLIIGSNPLTYLICKFFTLYLRICTKFTCANLKNCFWISFKARYIIIIVLQTTFLAFISGTLYLLNLSHVEHNRYTYFDYLKYSFYNFLNILITETYNNHIT